MHLALDRPAKAGCIPETIVVGVWNNGKLHRSEYFPQKFLQLMPGALRESVIQQRPEARPHRQLFAKHCMPRTKA